MSRPVPAIPGRAGARPAWLLPLACLLLLTTGLPAADAPTVAQWTPVETALKAQDPAAETQLLAITANFPKWPDGWRSLAQWQLGKGRDEPALAAAQRALALDPKDAVSGAIAVQVLGRLGRRDDAYAIADRFADARDAQGWVNYEAGTIAAGAGALARAERHLGVAMGRTTSAIPPEFSFLDARVAELRKDWTRAVASLNNAVTKRDAFPDAWYELGRLQLMLASDPQASTAEQRLGFLAKAEAAFLKVTTLQAGDADAWLGAGCVRMAKAQTQVADDPEAAKATARTAIEALDKAAALREASAEIQLQYGNALVLTERYADAIPHLRRAQELGSSDRAIITNLMLAYQHTGETAELARINRTMSAISPNERLTQGIAFYTTGSYPAAASTLAAVAKDLTDDPVRAAAALRFAGHAEAHQAAQVRAAGGKAEDAEALLDAAREHWRAAGGQPDYNAQHAYLAQETARSAKLGYAAGWQYLAWNSYLAPAGWAAVVGNYGTAVTDGRGFSGLWETHPVHAVVWGLLVVVPFILFLVGLRRRGAPVSEDVGTVRVRVAPRTVAAAPRPPAAAAKPAVSAKAPVARPSAPARPAAPAKPAASARAPVAPARAALPARPAAPAKAPAPRQTPRPSAPNPEKDQTEQALRVIPDPERQRSDRSTTDIGDPPPPRLVEKGALERKPTAPRRPPG
jgi:hypothetical protein